MEKLNILPCNSCNTRSNDQFNFSTKKKICDHCVLDQIEKNDFDTNSSVDLPKKIMSINLPFAKFLILQSENPKNSSCCNMKRDDLYFVIKRK